MKELLKVSFAEGLPELTHVARATVRPIGLQCRQADVNCLIESERYLQKEIRPLLFARGIS